MSSVARIEAVEVIRLTLPLAAPFHTAHGVERDRRLSLVRVVTEEGEGWGECVAPTSPGYTTEWAERAPDVIEQVLAPRLVRGEPVAGATHPMAVAAVELARLDAELRSRGESLAARLGAVVDRVPSGIALGLDATVDDVEKAVDGRYRRVKLKIGPGRDIDRVAAVRERWPDLALQVDANGAYTRADADHLARLDDLGLLLIEQPLPVDDLDGHAELARRLRTPICLDESITSVDAANDALARGACTIVCVKAARLGGYLEAARLHDVCRRAGVPVWCGGMLETGIGRAANLALAALPGFTLPGDLTASDRWYADDLTEPVVLDADGYLPVPDSAGLGVTPRREVVERFATSRVTVRP